MHKVSCRLISERGIIMKSSIFTKALITYSVFLFTPFIHGSTEADGTDTAARVGSVSLASDWIIGQMHEDTHLLRSYDNPAEFNSWTYDQAVGVIALLETGHRSEARLVLDEMLNILERSETNRGITAFADGYEWDTGNEILGAETRAAGPNAWMGLALLHGYRTLRDSRYIEAARDIAIWLIDNLRVEEGELAAGFLGGVVPGVEGPLQWISTEHQADVLAFLRGLEVFDANPPSPGTDWGDYATALEKWMLTPVRRGGLWNRMESHFIVGYESIAPPRVSSFNEVLDSQTWTVLAFDASRRATGGWMWRDRVGLNWLDENWRVSVNCGGVERVGFSKRTFDYDDPAMSIVSYWAEGMGGYALARLLAPPLTWGSLWTGFRVVRDLGCFQETNGGVLYSVGETIDLNDYFDGDPPPNDFPIAVFSSFNNILGGEPGVFGDAQPDWANRNVDCRLVSWFYSPAEVGAKCFLEEYVRSPNQSFALVNDSDRSDRYVSHPGPPGWNDDFTAWNPHQWASFTLTLNPKKGSGKAPAPRDISGFSELRFWARAKAPGAFVKVFISDGAGDHFWPPVGNHSVDHEDWELVKVPLNEVPGVDLALVHAVGVSFGNEVNGVPLNSDQSTLWVEDFSFYSSDEELPELKVFPDNWSWESVAATSWFIFARHGLNPFAVYPYRCGDDRDTNLLDPDMGRRFPNATPWLLSPRGRLSGRTDPCR